VGIETIQARRLSASPEFRAFDVRLCLHSFFAVTYKSRLIMGTLGFGGFEAEELLLSVASLHAAASSMFDYARRTVSLRRLSPVSHAPTGTVSRSYLTAPARPALSTTDFHRWFSDFTNDENSGAVMIFS